MVEEKKFRKIFTAPKDLSLNFRESLLNYCCAILLISAVISILEYFGSLLPARTVTVKNCIKIMINLRSNNSYTIQWSKKRNSWTTNGQRCGISFTRLETLNSTRCEIPLKTIKRLILEILWLIMGTLWIVLSRSLYNGPILETMLLQGKAEASSNILSYE